MSMTLKELVSAIVQEDNADARLKLMQDNVAMFETGEGEITQEMLDELTQSNEETLALVEELRGQLAEQKQLYHDAFINGVEDTTTNENEDEEDEEETEPTLDELLEDDLREARERKGLI